MEPTLSDLHQALVNADKAGDAVGAQALADHIRTVQAQPPPAAAPASSPPSTADMIQTNPVIGAPLHTLGQTGLGIEQLLGHGAATASDLGGYVPNSFSKLLHSLADHIDQIRARDKADYDAAAARVDATSTNPQASKALRATGELAGNFINPAGMGGSLIEAAPGIANAALRGAAGGAGFAASQPVDDTENYWLRKGEQIATGASTGAAVGSALGRAGGAGEPPSTKDLKSAAGDAYKEAEAQGAIIKKDSFESAIGDIKAAAEKAGIDPQLTPRSTAVLARLEKDAALGDMTLEKAETLRKVALSGLDTPQKADRRITHLVIDKLDDYMDSLKPADIAAGNAPEAVSALQNARELYARGAKSADIDRLVERARNAVGANYTAAGMDTALRQQFRAVANNQNAFNRYSPDERAAILKIVRGDTLQNTLRYVGKLSPTSGIALGAEIIGGLQHPEIAVPAAVLGYGARQGSARMGLNKVNTLSELVRSGGNLPSPTPAPALKWNPFPAVATDAALAVIPK